ncbi:uncharacterized protein LOC142556250 isoform X2 [Primulina tabacum]|uniref:uncharacterized protein LOC142556250 isoform X2 n=1 Tax=Primulina tabacum TaxID=48773 RepID=UPI003F59C79A
MEESSLMNTIFRKRKEISSSSEDQFDGSFTRSKAQMCIDRSGSGRSLPEVISEEPSPVAGFSGLNRGNAWGGSSIKDLRARRVFTPDVNSILQEQNEEKWEEGKESLEGLNSQSVQGPVFDMGSGSMKVDEISAIKNEANSGDGSVIRSKMALTLSTKRKVFKTPGSFSYRRLLPYLTDTLNDDSQIELVDVVTPCMSRGSCTVKSNSKSYIENYHNDCVERQKCHPENTKSSKDKVMQNFQSGLLCNNKDFRGRQDKGDDPSKNIGPHRTEQRNHQDGTSHVHVSSEEKLIQMTPPDPDIFSQTENGVDTEYVESSTFLTENQIRTNNYVCLNQSLDGKQLSDSIDSLVLNPSSRRRVFKHPRSLSYRRLLPFLLEISNDNSIKRQKPVVEIIEKPHPLATGTSVEQKQVKKLLTEISSGTQQTEILEEVLLPADILPVGSSRDAGAKPSSSTHISLFTADLSNVKPSSEVSDIGDSPCVILGLQTGGILQSQSSPRKLETECPHTDTNGLEMNEHSTLQIEESEQVAKQTKCSDLGLELFNDNRESIEDVQLNQGMLKMDVCNSLFSTIAGPPKGILKKNPRGCRGPCNCLNCASFHLHAERAFEFSKNQMHDAEEVALELMKELARLRHLLNKSITNENGSEIAPLNLVKQACAKSLETEKLAKVRLCQLNCDLNIHCRIPALLQPKVTFSNNIRERAFPTSDQLVSMAKTE